MTEVDPEPVESDMVTVGLCVLNPTGLFFNRGILYDADRKPGSWHWPESAAVSATAAC